MKDVVFLLDIVIFPTKVKEFIILAKMFMLKKYTLNKNQNLFMIQCWKFSNKYNHLIKNNLLNTVNQHKFSKYFISPSGLFFMVLETVFYQFLIQTFPNYLNN